ARAHAVVRPPSDRGPRARRGRRARVGRAPVDRLVPHRLARAARGLAPHVGHRPFGRAGGQDLMTHFGTVTTAMVTPFSDDGALDVGAAVTLARWLTDHGSDGLVVAGTTGEGPVLTDDERVELWQAVAEAGPGPVVAGTGTNDTAHSGALTPRDA